VKEKRIKRKRKLVFNEKEGNILSDLFAYPPPEGWKENRT